MANIIPAEIITAITGATDTATIEMQGNAIIQMLEAYLEVLLVKKDIQGEKITLPYAGKIIQPKYAPINSVSKVEILQKDGTYKEHTTPMSVGAYSIEFLESGFFFHCREHAVASIKLSYNAGYFSSWTEFPAILQQAAEELLKYMFVSDFNVGFQSEHLGDYSYTKGNIKRGLPVEIATILDGVVL